MKYLLLVTGEKKDFYSVLLLRKPNMMKELFTLFFSHSLLNFELVFSFRNIERDYCTLVIFLKKCQKTAMLQFFEKKLKSNTRTLLLQPWQAKFTLVKIFTSVNDILVSYPVLNAWPVISAYRFLSLPIRLRLSRRKIFFCVFFFYFNYS